LFLSKQKTKKSLAINFFSQTKCTWSTETSFFSTEISYYDHTHLIIIHTHLVSVVTVLYIYIPVSVIVRPWAGALCTSSDKKFVKRALVVGVDFIFVKAKQANKNERMAGPNSNILPINPLDPPTSIGSWLWVVGCSAAPCTKGAKQSNHTTTKIAGFSCFCKCSE